MLTFKLKIGLVIHCVKLLGVPVAGAAGIVTVALAVAFGLQPGLLTTTV